MIHSLAESDPEEQLSGPLRGDRGRNPQNTRWQRDVFAGVEFRKQMKSLKNESDMLVPKTA